MRLLVFMLLFALITPPALADEVPLEVFFREYFGQWKPDADIDTIVATYWGNSAKMIPLGQRTIQMSRQDQIATALRRSWNQTLTL